MADMLAHTALVLSLAIRVYDMYGLPPGELAAARATAERILEDADLRVTWTECPCAEPVNPAELVIRVAAATPQSEAASLGFAYIDVDRKAGTLATVFADRVRILAAAAGTGAGELLGRAMAHEIGHLLLGTRDHDLVGLMRGQWTTIELARNRQADWLLSRQAGSRLRQALVRRLRAPWRPAAVVAGGWPARDVSAP